MDIMISNYAVKYWRANSVRLPFGVKGNMAAILATAAAPQNGH